MDFELRSDGINNGRIDCRYGRLENNNIQGIPQISIPMEWTDPPPGTVAFALTCIDYDNYEEEGFAWLHWSVANIPVHVRSLPENCSKDIHTIDKRIVQGKTTWAGELDPETPECNRYGGPAPDKGVHEYEFRIYCLSHFLDLENGYYHNRLRKAMDGKILAEAAICGEYVIEEMEMVGDEGD